MTIFLCYRKERLTSALPIVMSGTKGTNGTKVTKVANGTNRSSQKYIEEDCARTILHQIFTDSFEKAVLSKIQESLVTVRHVKFEEESSSETDTIRSYFIDKNEFKRKVRSELEKVLNKLDESECGKETSRFSHIVTFHNGTTKEIGVVDQWDVDV